MSDLEAVKKETLRIAGGHDEQSLKIGVVRGFNDKEIQYAAAEFAAGFPDVLVEICYGNHDEQYEKLRNNAIDMAINDQRRKFSDEYLNEILAEREYCIEISSKSLISGLDSIEISDLKNIPCILLSNKTQQAAEQNFYTNDMGFKSDIIFFERLEDARMSLVQGKGYMPLEGGEKQILLGDVTKQILLTRDGKPIMRRYCAFAKANNTARYAEDFIRILKKEYEV